MQFPEMSDFELRCEAGGSEAFSEAGGVRSMPKLTASTCSAGASAASTSTSLSLADANSFVLGRYSVFGRVVACESSVHGRSTVRGREALEDCVSGRRCVHCQVPSCSWGRDSAGFLAAVGSNEMCLRRGGALLRPPAPLPLSTGASLARDAPPPMICCTQQVHTPTLPCPGQTVFSLQVSYVVSGFRVTLSLSKNPVGLTAAAPTAGGILPDRMKRKCAAWLVWMFTVVQQAGAPAPGNGLPERVGGRRAMPSWAGRDGANTSCTALAHDQDRTVGRGAPSCGAFAARNARGAESLPGEWGEVEQQCDHFTRASWTPGAQHMSHNMEREEGKTERDGDTHVNAFGCFFKQRYWVKWDAWDKPVGPVLLVVGGESPIDGSIDGFIVQVAAELKAMIVVVEHRFYGSSVPRGWNSSNGLGLLTVQQAVADLGVFRDRFRGQVLSTMGYSDQVWVTVGCGYAGALATWARIKYPTKFAGSWSSSPPLLPATEFPQHDMHDRDTVGDECARSIEILLESLEAQLEEDSAAGDERYASHQVKQLFQLPGKLAGDELWLIIHDSISIAVQHGFRKQLCDALGKTERRADLVPIFANLTLGLWGTGFVRDCHFHPACLSDVERGLSSARAWLWQQCTQIGLFATTPKSKERLGIRHRRMDAAFFMRRCVNAFGKGTRTDPHSPRQAFKGPAGNVIVISARDDPWKHAARVPHLEPDEEIMIDCEGCGQCFDMLPQTPQDPSQLQETRDRILVHLRRWI